MILNLNAVMSIIANVPAAIVSTVCSLFLAFSPDPYSYLTQRRLLDRCMSDCTAAQ